MAILPGGTAVLWLTSVESAAKEVRATASSVAEAARQRVGSAKPAGELVSYIDTVLKPQTAKLEALLQQDIVAVLKQQQQAKLAEATEQLTAALAGIDNALSLATHSGHPLAAALAGARACLATTKTRAESCLATAKRRAEIARANIPEPLPIEQITAKLTALRPDGDLMRAAEEHLLHVGDMVTLMRQVIHEEVFEIGERIPQRKPLPSTVFEQHVRDDWRGLLTTSSGAGQQWARAIELLRAEYAVTGGRGA